MAPAIKTPSRYRCLRGAAIAVVCLGVAGLLTLLDDSHCAGVRKVLVSCEHVPGFLVPLCLIGAAVGVLHTAYRAYRDFWVGDYLWDLKRAGQI
jgi:hypothetical protein